MHSYAFSLISEIQDECRDVSRKTAADILAANFPSKSRDFLNRNLAYILALSPDDLARLIGYPDPTGEKAVRNVMDAEAARSECEAVAA
ncbi:hypothetical protein [Corynebacterium sp.]|uniref:hypothetical protein n=1 Tax=Corynebacterium sp. TaxID=1720 RepID=UPI002F3FC905